MMLRGVWWCTRRPRWRILSASCTDHLIASYLAILLSRNLQLCIRISVGGVNLGVLLFATLQKKRFCWKMKIKLFILCGAWLAWLFTQMSALLATILRWLTAIFAFGRSNHLETVAVTKTWSDKVPESSSIVILTALRLFTGSNYWIFC